MTYPVRVRVNLSCSYTSHSYSLLLTHRKKIFIPINTPAVFIHSCWHTSHSRSFLLIHRSQLFTPVHTPATVVPSCSYTSHSCSFLLIHQPQLFLPAHTPATVSHLTSRCYLFLFIHQSGAIIHSFSHQLLKHHIATVIHFYTCAACLAATGSRFQTKPASLAGKEYYSIQRKRIPGAFQRKLQTCRLPSWILVCSCHVCVNICLSSPGGDNIM